MWWTLLYVIVILLLVYLSASTIYLLFLALSYFAVKDRHMPETSRCNRFAIMVPAHNEELLIGGLCSSISQLDYPKDFFDAFVIADNCVDRTADVCGSFDVHCLIRSDPSNTGKGHALSWGLQHIPLERFDAVFIVDADNIIDPGLLSELNKLLNDGEQAIQCYNSVRNRDDSWFTQLLFVSRTIGNLLYHHSKYKLGLSSYLMGNGLCFTSALLQKKGWTAFTVGEDWEYYAGLIDDRIKIGFAAAAKVFHQESRTLHQATSQRLRWSSGRFHVAERLGLPLFLKGIRNRDWFTVDASLPLIFPNYSLQINLTLLTLILCFFLPAGPATHLLIIAGTALVFGQVLLFFTGICLAGSIRKVLRAVLHAPWFLAWKMAIDILTLTGIYKGEKWIRTERHISPSSGDGTG